MIEKNYSLFDLPEGITTRVEKSETDEFGMKHYIMKLEIFGIPIEDAYFSAHYSKDGDLMHVVGKYDKSSLPKEKIIPKISLTDAFERSKDAFIKSEHIENQEIIKNIDDELSNFFNMGNIALFLVYYSKDQKEHNLKLCYKVEISSEYLGKNKTIYINASSGETEKIYEHGIESIATIQSAYNGQRSVQVKWRGWPNSYYYLRNETNSTPIETRNSSINDYSTCRPYGFGNLDLVYKGDLNWPLDFKYNAASSHWAAEQAYSVFKNTYGRIYGTFSSSGGELRIENNYDTQFTFYDFAPGYDYIHISNTLGSTNGFDAGLDIVGHEFSHGVMYRARSIDKTLYDYEETGALAESFGDIFGELCEYYTLGSTDYVHGTNEISSAKRSLISPRDYTSTAYFYDYTSDCNITILYTNSYIVPLSWHDAYWSDDSNGSIRAHLNCSVQNYWFYLLANGNGGSVSGIGLTNAGRIAYRNMVYYLSLGSDFDDMRQASILNAAALFGECSDAYLQTQNAWAAVGVGSAGTSCLHTEITGPDYLNCDDYGSYTANVWGGSGTYYYTWYIDGILYSYGDQTIYPSWHPEGDMESHYIYVEVSDGSLSDSDDQSTYVYSCYGGQNLNNLNTLQIKMYPNPATTSTKVEIQDNESQGAFKGTSEYEIQILDKNGRIVYSGKSNSTEFNINTSSFEEGIYTTIIKKGKKIGTNKLVIN